MEALCTLEGVASNFTSTKFIENNATNAGGAIYTVDDLSSICKQNSASAVFTNNKAKFGDDCAGLAADIRFEFLVNGRNFQKSANDPRIIWPTTQFEINATFTDHYDNSIDLPGGMNVSGWSTNSNKSDLVYWSMAPHTIVYPNLLTGVAVYTVPLNAVKKTNNSNSIDNTLQLNLPYAPNITFLVMPCPAGHFSIDHRCFQCDSSSYSFDGTKPVCLPCPSVRAEDQPNCMTHIPTFANLTMSFKEGLWSDQNGTDLENSQLKVCPMLHGCANTTCNLTITSNPQNHQWSINCSTKCAEGYTNHACSQCNEHYYQNSDRCEKCDNASVVTIGIITVLILTVFLLFLDYPLPLIILEGAAVILLMILAHQQLGIVAGVLVVLIIASTSSQSLTSGALVTSFIFYVQCSSMIIKASLLPLAWQEVLAHLQITNLQISGIECYIPYFRAPFNRELFTLTFPVVLCAFIIVAVIINDLIGRGINAINGIKMKEKRKERARGLVNSSRLPPAPTPLTCLNDEEFTSSPFDEQFEPLIRDDELLPPVTKNETLAIKIFRATLFFLFYVQFFIVARMMSLIQCSSQGNMTLYPFVPCSEANWPPLPILALSVMGFIFYGIILSLVWVFLIRINRQGIKNNSAKMNAWFGFFHGSYKERYKWWNILILARRLTLACLIGLLGAR